MFNHLKNLDPKGQTAELPVPELGDDAVLVVRPATEANSAYFKGQLKGLASSSAVRRRGRVDPATLVKARETDRTLYPAHVVVGWRGVMNDRGEPAQFSRENCSALLEALPDWLFDVVRAFCGDIANFVDLPDESEKEELGNV